MKLTTPSTNMPEAGPKAKVVIRIGISAKS